MCPWMDSSGDWHETSTTSCGDFPECHDPAIDCGHADEVVE